jgi:hypothetical protein
MYKFTKHFKINYYFCLNPYADTKEELLLKTSQDLAVTKDYFFNQLKDSKTG